MKQDDEISTFSFLIAVVQLILLGLGLTSKEAIENVFASFRGCTIDSACAGIDLDRRSP